MRRLGVAIAMLPHDLAHEVGVMDTASACASRYSRGARRKIAAGNLPPAQVLRMRGDAQQCGWMRVNAREMRAHARRIKLLEGDLPAIDDAFARVVGVGGVDRRQQPLPVSRPRDRSRRGAQPTSIMRCTLARARAASAGSTSTSSRI